LTALALAILAGSMFVIRARSVHASR
jgi:hypothetical protein